MGNKRSGGDAAMGKGANNVSFLFFLFKYTP